MSAQPSKVIPIGDERELTGILQDELLATIRKEKYDELTLAQTVGVLEFLKWNLINGA